MEKRFRIGIVLLLVGLLGLLSRKVAGFPLWIGGQSLGCCPLFSSAILLAQDSPQENRPLSFSRQSSG